MSYEGYVQILCENGHYECVDCWDDHDPDAWLCEVCGAKMTWWNSVDVTNGSWDYDPTTGEEVRIDGYVELEVDKPPVKEKCPCCGYENETEEETYKIPEDKGHRVQ